MSEPNVENIRAWVAALRSGEYKQGHERLRNGDRYCCLGVLCELAVNAGAVERASLGGLDFGYGKHWQSAVLPGEVVIDVGVAAAEAQRGRGTKRGDTDWEPARDP